MTAGDLTTALARRVRDPNNTAHSTTIMRSVLTQAQRMVNARTNALLTTLTLTLPARTPILNLVSVASTFVRVSTVRVNNRSLDLVDWRQLVHIDPRWWRRTADRPRRWGMVGRTCLLVWPPHPTDDLTVTVVATKLTADLASAAAVIELPDQHSGAILLLAEELILLRHRLLKSLEAATARAGGPAVDVGRVM